MYDYSILIERIRISGTFSGGKELGNIFVFDEHYCLAGSYAQRLNLGRRQCLVWLAPIARAAMLAATKTMRVGWPRSSRRCVARAGADVQIRCSAQAL